MGSSVWAGSPARSLDLVSIFRILVSRDQRRDKVCAVPTTSSYVVGSLSCLQEKGARFIVPAVPAPSCCLHINHHRPTNYVCKYVRIDSLANKGKVVIVRESSKDLAAFGAQTSSLAAVIATEATRA